MTIPALLIAAALAAGAGFGGLLAWRLWRSLPAAPEWTWRNIMALIAIVATIGGAAVLTLLAWWLLSGFGEDADRLINELVRDPHARPEVGQVLVIIYEAMAWGLKLLLAGVIVVLLSLGLVITPRRIKVDKTGAELSGGFDDEAVPVKVTNPPNAPVPVDAHPQVAPPLAPKPASPPPSADDGGQRPLA